MKNKKSMRRRRDEKFFAAIEHLRALHSLWMAGTDDYLERELSDAIQRLLDVYDMPLGRFSGHEFIAAMNGADETQEQFS